LKDEQAKAIAGAGAKAKTAADAAATQRNNDAVRAAMAASETIRKLDEINRRLR